MEKQLKQAGPAGGRSTRESDSTAPGHVDLTDGGMTRAHCPPPVERALAIEFLPEKPGAYGFACQMGMLRGKLIIE